MLPIPDPRPIAKPKPKKKGGVGRNIGKVIGGIGRKVARQPAVRKSRRRSSGGGSSGGGNGGRGNSGGGGGNSGAIRRVGRRVRNEVSRRQPQRPKKTMTTPGKITQPKVPDIIKYLGGDAIYQDALRSGKASLADFLSEMNRRRGEAGTQYTQTTGSMNRDRTQQLEDLKNEFASRGLINSGLYGEEQGRFQQRFTEQMQALQQQQSSLLADLLSQESNYKRENSQQNEIAKQQALARRASKYKIG